MIKKKNKIRVLFNDAHSNLPSSIHIPQGGVSRFAEKICSYFNKEHKDIELISLLFSHNTKDNDIYVRETKANRMFYELVYPTATLTASYKKMYTKKEYIKFLKPQLDELGLLFKKIQPDVIFLNGFSLSNWFILEAAYRQSIPVCIQHAGIWKMELNTSQKVFSPSIKKIFSSFEKDTHHKAKIQIFLNEFSRDVFFNIHNIKIDKKSLMNTRIIPLPIDIKGYKNIHIPIKKIYNIGVVARWDRIKNHDAILRLANYIKKNNLPYSINTVTRWDKTKPTLFKSKYENVVNVVDPMSPDKLKNFYNIQDIILIPSRFDVSPTVLMEALFAGKPAIISSNVGWVTDYKKFGLGKLVISPTSSGATIYKAINDIILNRISYTNKFKLIQKKIINKHNIDVVFKQYYDIFKKLS